MIEELYSALRDMNSTVIVFTLQTLAFLLEKVNNLIIPYVVLTSFLIKIKLWYLYLKPVA